MIFYLFLLVDGVIIYFHLFCAYPTIFLFLIMYGRCFVHSFDCLFFLKSDDQCVLCPLEVNVLPQIKCSLRILQSSHNVVSSFLEHFDSFIFQKKLSTRSSTFLMILFHYMFFLFSNSHQSVPS